jgi:hypothetical protein
LGQDLKRFGKKGTSRVVGRCPPFHVGDFFCDPSGLPFRAINRAIQSFNDHYHLWRSGFLLTVTVIADLVEAEFFLLIGDHGFSGVSDTDDAFYR